MSAAATRIANAFSCTQPLLWEMKLRQLCTNWRITFEYKILTVQRLANSNYECIFTLAHKVLTGTETDTPTPTFGDLGRVCG